MTKPKAVAVAAFGTVNHVPDEPSYTFDQRIGRCYELAGHAVLSRSVPEGTMLVHGSWHGPYATRRIGHAWLVLPDGNIWEPITMEVFTPDDFFAWTNAIAEVEYDWTEAAYNAVEFESYGRWHESEFP